VALNEKMVVVVAIPLYLLSERERDLEMKRWGEKGQDRSAKLTWKRK